MPSAGLAAGLFPLLALPWPYPLSSIDPSTRAEDDNELALALPFAVGIRCRSMSPASVKGAPWMIVGEGMSATRPLRLGGVDDALAVLVLELV